MDRESIILLNFRIKVFSTIINLIRMVLSIIVMVKNMKEILKKVENLERVCIPGQMAHIMKDSIKTILKMGKADIRMLMILFGRASG